MLTTFLKLGFSAFGGPVAHLGYFREELVVRQAWIAEADYADLVALCQFLPGPASSQVGFALGVLRGRGLLGGLAAWIGFTLPSAILLALFAVFARATRGPLGSGLIHGLKLVAVAIVAQAVWGMARSLAPDRARAAIAMLALGLATLLPGLVGQLGAIMAGMLLGWMLCRADPVIAAAGDRPAFPVSAAAGMSALALFGILLSASILLPAASPRSGLALFGSFYRSGALVFGGGHVVLPLLQAAVVRPGWISQDLFLSGYGAAQAVPGPLFTFAAFLGAAMQPAAPLGPAMLALVAIFLPGLLLVYGMLPFWDQLRRRATTQAAMRGANAAVVGVLGAALYRPLWTGSVGGAADFVVVATAFLLLTVWKAPPWAVVVLTAGAGLAISLAT